MDSKKVKIALDVFGGDYAPDVCVEGAYLALKEDKDLEILAVGKKSVVEPMAKKSTRITPVFAEEVIEMDEHPTDAVRKKKDSSIVTCAKLIREGQADGFFSAGSTGACLAASILVAGRIKGVKRPAIGAVLPAYSKPCLLMDVGANADCKPDMLVQFAKIGSLYMEHLYGVKSPKIGLLNIGEEDSKGSEFAIKTNKLLRDKIDNFEGNCEGRDLLCGDFDVVVTDGFSGNIALKTIEGTGKMMFWLLKDVLMSGSKEKVGALLLKDKMKELKKKTDSEEQGGSPLLGVRGAVVIGHGTSGAKGVKNGILETAKTARAGLVDAIAEVI